MKKWRDFGGKAYLCSPFETRYGQNRAALKLSKGLYFGRKQHC